MLDRLAKLQAEYASLPPAGRDAYLHRLDTDKAFQREVSALALHFLGKRVGGCGWCALSALVELLKLNQKKIEKMERKNTLGFRVLAGTFLHDPVNRDAGKILTPHTLSDDLALYHLAFNPNSRKYFTALPDNVDELVAAYIRNISAEAAEVARDVKNRQLSALKAKRAAIRKAYDNAAQSLEELEKTLVDLDERIYDQEKEAEEASKAEEKPVLRDAEEIPAEIDRLAREKNGKKSAMASIVKRFSDEIKAGVVSREQVKDWTRKSLEKYAPMEVKDEE